MSNSTDAMKKRKACIKERVDRMCYFYWDFNQDMRIRQHFNRHLKEERERERRERETERGRDKVTRGICAWKEEQPVQRPWGRSVLQKLKAQNELVCGGK